MAAYDLTSTVEYDYNFTAATPASIKYLQNFSAFSNSATTIVTVTVSTAFLFTSVVNAGYGADFTYNPTSVNNSATFYLGDTSQAGSESFSTTAVNTMQSTFHTGGPNDANLGYGTLELGTGVLSSSYGTAINFFGTANTLILDTASPDLGSNVSIATFQGSGDQIVFNGVSDVAGSITGYSNGVLSYVNNGVAHSLNLTGLVGTVTASNFRIGNLAAIEGGNNSSHAGSLVISYVSCFLRGTMIAVPGGETAVETLRAGDLVDVWENGRLVARPIAWTGGRHIAAGELGSDDAAFPVRIRRHAFGPDIPHRDLLITAEHCVLVDDGLTPIRMLVNGASIVVDLAIPAYEVFHVELSTHGILMSEGLATESYLDSGHRDLFVGSGTAIAARGDLTLAAPLAVSRAVVEPIWHRLASRAIALGHDRDDAIVPLTDQPDLRLLLACGRELPARWHNDQRYMFQIPRGGRAIRLLSRSAVPADTIGRFVDDRRTLGVAVDRMVLWQGLGDIVIKPGSSDRTGWYPAENGVHWTDGSAALDLPVGAEATFLDIHLAGTLPYRMDARPA